MVILHDLKPKIQSWILWILLKSKVLTILFSIFPSSIHAFNIVVSCNTLYRQFVGCLSYSSRFYVGCPYISCFMWSKVSYFLCYILMPSGSVLWINQDLFCVDFCFYYSHSILLFFDNLIPEMSRFLVNVSSTLISFPFSVSSWCLRTQRTVDLFQYASTFRRSSSILGFPMPYCSLNVYENIDHLIPLWGTKIMFVVHCLIAYPSAWKLLLTEQISIMPFPCTTVYQLFLQS